MPAEWDVRSDQLPNRKSYRRVVLIAAGVIVAVVTAWALWPDRDTAAAPGGTTGQAFFSTDDGKSWFADDVRSLAPFQKDGKEALRAYVFKGADGKPFVSCLARYTPAARKELEAIYARNPEKPNPFITNQLELDGMEVKAPGQSTWLKRSDPRAAELLMPRLPDGRAAELVLP
jgi:hypothetical protein